MKHLRYLLLPILFLICLHSQAQVNNLRIENMTDEQIVMVLKQYNLSGLSELELEQKALEKGIPPEQIKAIQKRLSNMDPQLLLNSGKSISPSTMTEGFAKRNYLPSLGPNRKKNDSTLQVFGADLFDTDHAGFEVNLSIATPTNYVLGPQD